MLIALGYRSISMVPSSIGPVKAMIRSVNAADAAAKLHELIENPEARLRQEFQEFAQATGAEI